MIAARTTGRTSGPSPSLPFGTTFQRTPWRGLAALGAGAVLLTACAAPPRTSPAPHPAPSGSAPATDDATAVATELRPYYGQRPAWRPCDQADGFQCVTMRVPLDHAHPEAGDILVSATRKRSGGGRLGSLQLDPGGPGAYDLVAMAPGSVGRGALADCDTGRPVAFMWDTMFRKTADECERHVGGLLPYVGKPDAARDMDMLRSPHYAGFSYGTRLGATHALDALGITLHLSRGLPGAARTPDTRRGAPGERTTKEGDRAQAAVSCVRSTIGPRLSAVRAVAALPRFLGASPRFGRTFADAPVMRTHRPAHRGSPYAPSTRGAPPRSS